MNKYFIISMASLLISTMLSGQDAGSYKLQLSVPVIDLPQNTGLPYAYPSMNQALEWSKDFYELGFWGIDELGDGLFLKRRTTPHAKGRIFANNLFKYALGLGFSKYGSELPIPLGVWGHEEYHRSALGVAGVASKNGNWLLSRWDGTVYGVSDESLSMLKEERLDQLLYAYVAGVQYETMLNERVTLEDFYNQRSLTKNALLLYNAHYVYNYFKFSTSPHSDSVKILAPPHESPNPVERDFAGADLTAWVYDMFNPEMPFTARESFPNGEGVNRRVGFSDLSPEAQEYLVKQRKLSLLNFANPAIFFVNKIRLGQGFAFNVFAQYAPTHFGNGIALVVPLHLHKHKLLLSMHNYNSHAVSGYGLGLGVFGHRISHKLNADLTLNLWEQPQSFWGTGKHVGGALQLKGRYALNPHISCFAAVTGKTKGWIMGNPYLAENVSMQMGIDVQIKKQ